MEDFGFLGEIDFPLGDDIRQVTADQPCFIANSKEANCEVVANEIDFFLQNSPATPLVKAQSLSRIYHARAAFYDYSNRLKACNKIGEIFTANTLYLADFSQKLSNSNLTQNAVCFDTKGEAFDAVALLVLLFSGVRKIVVDELDAEAEFVNALFTQTGHEKAVFTSFEETQACQSTQEAYFDERMTPQELLAHYTQKLCSKGDFGVLQTTRFGQVSITPACTLCACCVGVCQSVALKCEGEAITFNASLCNNCGECVTHCAEEGVIALEAGLKLAPQSFIWRELVRDEAQKCAQCGKEFAPKRAIERIAGILNFDPSRAKLLYLCADCKVKNAAFSDYLNDY